jgi:hypothetical protein
MKKLAVINLAFTLLLFLSGCVLDDYGNADWWPLHWFIGIMVVIFILVIIFNSSQRKATNEKLAKMGLKVEDFKRTGSSYVGGHPDVDDMVPMISYRIDGDNIIFYEHNDVYFPEKRFVINKNSIKNITGEDASSMEKRVSLGRMLFVGVFAFAWRKKEKKELAFVVIDWNDGRFDHSTTFNFEGIENAMTRANTMRNNLIRAVR